MLVDGQPQTIVVDQQQIAYQPAATQQQFIVQEANVEQQQNNQVYYMQQDTMQDNSSHNEPAACETPIVLNHHIQQGQLRGQIVAQKVAQHASRPSPGIVQVRQQLQVSYRNIFLTINVMFFFFLIYCWGVY